MIDRRTVLLSSMAAVAASLLPVDGEAKTKIKRTRYNVSSEKGQKMLAIYARAVNKMKTLSDQDPLSWTFQWFIHAAPTDKAVVINEVYGNVPSKNRDLALASWWTCQPHSKGQPGDYFLPWHRLYVLQFEEIIRQVSGVAEFTLPYWDYTNPAQYSIPPQFQKASMNDPKWAPLFVIDRNLDSSEDQTADVNAGEPLNKYYPGDENPLVLPPMAGVPYSEFCDQLDDNLHGMVHVLTGNGETNMGVVPWAAKDPVFWLHHCNIDRIWYNWSVLGGKNPSETGGTNWQDIHFVFPTPQGTAQNPSFSSVADIATLPYDYEDLPEPPAKTSVPVAALAKPLLVAQVTPEAAAKVSTTQDGIALGDQPITLPLAPVVQQQAEANSRLQATGGSAQRVVIILKNITANENPGALFKVYLEVKNTADGQSVRRYAGVLNFFSLIKHGSHGGSDPHAGHAMAGDASEDVTFDISRLVQSNAISADQLAAASVTLVPVGKVKLGSAPQIKGGIEVQLR
ncbi:tyrosinase family protein [Rhizobium paknamense]|uniref:Tyrosinase n=1 Tax=Rhizobium paknamense TaxID=1206817 RepID=A0ABU0I7P7_9HYPH|nr:tyrosinase family protein [Rhizobium paknamense]MDQ0454248.1 tyrosinase [Rhizobium paknamense]